jgi:hypothetical protein
VRRTVESQPKLAHIIEACEKARQERSRTAPAPQPPSEQTFIGNTALAKQVMQSDIGRRACELGVAQSVWLYAWRDSKSDFTDQDLRRYKRALQEGADGLVELQDSVVKSSLSGLFYHMQQEEKRLNREYGASA